MDKFTINTIYYEKATGSKPNARTKGDWTFQVPANYGRKPFLFPQVSYAKAKKDLKDVAAHGGEFFLLP